VEGVDTDRTLQQLGNNLVDFIHSIKGTHLAHCLLKKCERNISVKALVQVFPFYSKSALYAAAIKADDDTEECLDFDTSWCFKHMSVYRSHISEGDEKPAKILQYFGILTPRPFGLAKLMPLALLMAASTSAEFSWIQIKHCMQSGRLCVARTV